MSKKNFILLAVTLLLIGGTALNMRGMKARQRLGLPGIKTLPIPGSPRLDVYLPAHVLDYDSVIVPTDTNVLNGLPQDTSFMQRRYISTDTNFVLMNVVLMGTDRTSIHKPQFCLTGSGWNIDNGDSSLDVVHVQSPHAYDLPVMKLVSSRQVSYHGSVQTVRGVYVYWFVADHDLTAQHGVRMWHTATHLIRSGELQRWAYVSCFSWCLPGKEDATYERMKKFIVAAVPQFQLAVPNTPAGGALASSQ